MVMLLGFILSQVFARPSLHNNITLLNGTLRFFVLEQLWHVVVRPSHSAASFVDFNKRATSGDIRLVFKLAFRIRRFSSN